YTEGAPVGVPLVFLVAWFAVTCSFLRLPVRYVPQVFRCPLSPFLPSLGMLATLHLIGSLGWPAYVRWVVWFTLGTCVYLSYGMHRSQGDASYLGRPSTSLQQSLMLASPASASSRSSARTSETGGPASPPLFSSLASSSRDAPALGTAVPRSSSSSAVGLVGSGGVGIAPSGVHAAFSGQLGGGMGGGGGDRGGAGNGVVSISSGDVEPSLARPPHHRHPAAYTAAAGGHQARQSGGLGRSHSHGHGRSMGAMDMVEMTA
ncbi:hypothetical protein Agub_g134, partial [Astrephomene gubernaculifera]